jgi:Flp pilus assembly protein TadG
MLINLTSKWHSRMTLKSSVAGFARNEAGSMTLFACFLIMMMLLVGGIGVDLMRNEMERTRVQATVDRAVLAAADLDQPLDPEAVVNDYFAKAGMSNYLTSVTVDEGLNYRTVTATANTSSPTRFMRFLGVDDLPVPARSQAEERVANVEISMVLDISGSMGWNNKMENLQAAAKVFVDTVVRDETEDLISISLIPYTAQVSAGQGIFEAMQVPRLTGNPSWCLDFVPTDFATATVRMDGTYEHMQYFDEGSNYSSPVNNSGCPGRDGPGVGSSRAYEQILPFSQDRDILKGRIDQYRARANTSIHIGMKWGVAMLDPSFKPVVQTLSLNNSIDAAFSARPAAYDDPETLKTVVLMTDGQNVNTTRIQPWYYDSESDRIHWTKYPLRWYLNRYVRRNYANWRYTKYTSSQADAMLEDICDAAKNQGIVVWSIGFEVTNYSAGVMENCASTPSHFFRVEGVEISEAFESIAKQINQLRLTQ